MGDKKNLWDEQEEAADQLKEELKKKDKKQSDCILLKEKARDIPGFFGGSSQTVAAGLSIHACSNCGLKREAFGLQLGLMKQFVDKGDDKNLY